MKFKSLAVGTLCVALATAPMTASAHGWYHGGYGYHGGGGLAFGLLAGAAVVTTAALTLPFALANAAVAPAPYYAPPPGYYAPAPAAYAQPQAYPPAGYGAPSYAPPGYYAQAPVYYAPQPYYYR